MPCFPPSFKETVTTLPVSSQCARSKSTTTLSELPCTSCGELKLNVTALSPLPLSYCGSNVIGVPTDVAWVSHLRAGELEVLRRDFPATTFRLRFARLSAIPCGSAI